MKQGTVLLFDVDGTLVNTEQGILNGVRYALDTLHADYSGLNLTEFIGPPLHTSFERVLHSEELAHQAVALYRERYDTGGWLDCTVYDGIPEALKALSNAGYRIATATSKPEKFAQRILQHFKLDSLFEHIVGATCDESREQKEDVIRYAMKLCGVQSDDCIMVGDRRYDLIGAQKTGMQAIGVLWGFGSLEELNEYPNIFIAKTPVDLCSYLTERDL
ncbi:HAD-IA family hydrolase [Acetanaerobacterium elongatum]|uniref:Phosphoglycolate phosphatase n=1 Tax=Acetanaerobacterium elongatum TaxID=258515 RepID=A0A1G9V3X1_9FIRM|nr:HAD-IA family hydrolase [Acetanaerobacterium elongatum]SDM66800.1 phosphoglycolate phosphatase [Acetanaerobacterium elongatum]